MIDVPVDLIHPLIDTVTRVTGFHLDPEQVVLTGTCANCLPATATA